jgi:4'-phosphopantetheinyl transferase
VIRRADTAAWGPLALLAGEVHVWRASLECTLGEAAELAGLLSGDERARADRLHFSRHRLLFIAGRGLLRRLLGRYVGRPPQSLRFTYGPLGKPALGPDGGRPLHFSLSHSSDRALFAVARDAPVGIDLERVRPGLDFEGIAHRFLPADAVRALEQAPESRKAAVFFASWTRMEALAKGGGTGLGAVADGTEASDGPVATGGSTGSGPLRQAPGRWFLHDLDVGTGYRAALAARLERPRLVVRQLVLEPTK